MPTEAPVDVSALRAELAAAEARVRDLTEMLTLAERLFGGGSRPRESGHDGGRRTETTDAPAAEQPDRVDGPLTDKSTTVSIQHVYICHEGEVLSVEDAVKEMKALGWDNGSPEPVDTARVAVSRWMKKDPSIERVRLGHYRYNPPGGGAVHQQTWSLRHAHGLTTPALNGAGALDRAEGD